MILKQQHKSTVDAVRLFVRLFDHPSDYNYCIWEFTRLSLLNLFERVKNGFKVIFQSLQTLCYKFITYTRVVQVNRRISQLLRNGDSNFYEIARSLDIHVSNYLL